MTHIAPLRYGAIDGGAFRIAIGEWIHLLPAWL
jgi:hypothetical protein